MGQAITSIWLLGDARIYLDDVARKIPCNI